MSTPMTSDCNQDAARAHGSSLQRLVRAPFYSDEWVTLYHGDAREIVPMLEADTLVSDPPYPNNAGHFDADIPAACDVLRAWKGGEAMVFWWEMDKPPMQLPHVATHIWHRTNVNGRPYEPVYHYAPDGEKRRSCVGRFPAIFNGAGPGCQEYMGHPTQKGVALMQWLIAKLRKPTVILDPFCGVGATLRAAKNLRIRAIGIEQNEQYCETTALRMEQGVLAL
jgi:DNA modification methylase